MSDRRTKQPQTDWAMVAEMNPTVRAMIKAGTPGPSTSTPGGAPGNGGPRHVHVRTRDGRPLGIRWHMTGDMRNIPMPDKPEMLSASMPLLPGTPEYQHLIDSSPVAQCLGRNGVPLNRENYIAANWPGGVPDPWTGDHEAELLAPSLRAYEADND